MAETAVVFDIGEVLLRWDPHRAYADLIPDADARTAFFDTCGMWEMNLDIDRGAPFRGRVEEQAARHPEQRDLILAWADRWADMAYDLIPGSWTTLRALRSQGTPVFALSNFGVETFEIAERLYPDLTEFDARFISGHRKVIKPDAAFYEMLETETGFSGEEIIFFDDRQANIDAAKARGWQAHLFTSSEAMTTTLIDKRILDHDMSSG